MSNIEVLERNLAALFARAYVPVRARESFRSELERDFLARAARFAGRPALAEQAGTPEPSRIAEPRKRNAPLATPQWRAVLAAAAVLLACVAVGVWYGRGHPGRSTLEEILARGEVAVRFEREGAWSARAAGLRAAPIEFAGDFVELHTPRELAASIAMNAPAESPTWTALEDSRVSLARGRDPSGAQLRVVELARGGLIASGGLTDSVPSTVRARAGELRFVHGEIRIVYEAPEDPSAWEAPPRADCEWLGVRVTSGEALVQRAGAAYTLAAGDEAFLSCGEVLLRLPASPEDARDEHAGDERGGSEPPQANEPAQPAEPPVLTGTVTRASDGVPLDEFRVVLLPLVQLPQYAEPQVHEFHAANGQFELFPAALVKAPVTSDVYRVEVQSAGLASYRLERFVVGASQPVVITAALELGATVRGIVVDDVTGLPIADAWVVAEHDTPAAGLAIDPDENETPSLIVATRTRTDGGFELAHLRPGAQILRATAGGYGPNWSGVFELPREGAHDGVEIRLSAAAKIVGSVREASGAGVPNVVLIASTSDFTRTTLSFDFALSDASGEFELRDLGAGRWTVLSFGPAEQMRTSLAPEIQFAMLRPGETARVDFHAKAPRQVLRGTVRDVEGRPIGGRNVMVAIAGKDGPPPEGAWVTATTAADGTYELPDVEPGSYSMCLTGRTPVEIVHVDGFEVVAGQTAVHDVVLHLGSITGTVRNATTGEPIEFVAVIVLRGAGSDEKFVANVQTDAHGFYEIPFLPPGLYSVAVHPSKDGLAQGTLEGIALGQGEQAERLDFELLPGASLELVVTDDGGAPVERAQVEFVDQRGRRVQFSESPLTDPRGHYRAIGMQPGHWRVSVRKEGFEKAEIEVDLQAGEHPQQTLVLRKR